MRIKPILATPCANCPFRTDIPPFLYRSRAREITASLLRGDSFPCHKTVNYDDNGRGRVNKRTKMCGGAAIMLYQMKRWNTIMQVAHRMGFFHPGELKLEAPVYRNARLFIAAQEADPNHRRKR